MSYKEFIVLLSSVVTASVKTSRSDPEAGLHGKAADYTDDRQIPCTIAV